MYKKFIHIILIIITTLFVGLLFSCEDGSSNDFTIYVSTDSTKYWKSEIAENNEELLLMPRYIDDMPYIDSVEYRWGDKHILTVHEMPFTGKMVIRVDSTGKYRLHNIVYYHGTHEIDYYIIYNIIQ